MKLSTNKLFSSLRPSKRYSKKQIIRSTRKKIKNNIHPISDKKYNYKINPFIKPIPQNKILTHRKIMSSKEQENIDLKFLKTEEDEAPSISTFVLTDESDSNNNKNEEFEIDNLCKIFKNSKLKTTIIIDKNGNNNLNSEQKEFFREFFSNKEENENNSNKCKVNTIRVQSYNHNNILLKQKNEKKKASNLKFQNINNNFANTERNRVKFLELITEKGENKKLNDNDENSSLFENFIYNSNDSSFIDSSFADVFLQN